MKKNLFAIILVLALCLSACGAPADSNADAPQTKPTDTSTVTTQPTDTKATEATQPDEYTFEPGYFPIPTEPATFTFLSGAGAWRSIIDINTDGTFTGTYSDAEMGTAGDGYESTYYVCEFSGVFSDVEKIDKYSYRIRLSVIDLNHTPGTEWIEDNIRYIASEAPGIYDEESKQVCQEYIVYMPNTPVAQLSEEFLNWWPYRNQGKDTLSCFGMRNTLSDAGYFYIPEA